MRIQDYILFSFKNVPMASLLGQNWAFTAGTELLLHWLLHYLSSSYFLWKLKSRSSFWPERREVVKKAVECIGTWCWWVRVLYSVRLVILRVTNPTGMNNGFIFIDFGPAMDVCCCCPVIGPLFFIDSHEEDGSWSKTRSFPNESI